jgi:hypothetical protein
MSFLPSFLPKDKKKSFKKWNIGKKLDKGRKMLQLQLKEHRDKGRHREKS